MALFYGENYKKQRIDKPSEKIAKGEVAGRKRLLLDRIIVPEDLANGDDILVGVLPANSLVSDAKIFINKSLGATGIVTLGHKASKDELGNAIAEDLDGFCPAADAGGQAAFTRAGVTSLSLYKRFGEETPIYLRCTEDVDGAVDDGLLVVEIEYVSD